MGDYCDGIDRINIELSIANKIALCDALAEFITGDLTLHAGDANIDKDVLIGDRRQTALEHIATVKRRWHWLSANLDLPLADAEALFGPVSGYAGPLTNRGEQPRLFDRLQDYSVRVSWKNELKPQLEAIFDGAVYRPVIAVSYTHLDVYKRQRQSGLVENGHAGRQLARGRTP